jgi:hypothetical protein
MLVVVVDRLDSALGRSAKSRQKSEKSIILATTNFRSPSHLLKAIMDLNPEVVLFSFRQAFVDALSLNQSYGYLKELHKRATFGLLIPDYIGLGEKEKFLSNEVLSSIDFILTTNLNLKLNYKRKLSKGIHVDTYHDLVNLEHISSYRNIAKIELKKIIWVGNSKWGARQGKIDHKGKARIVLPLISSNKLHNWEFEIIDSARTLLPHEVVIKKIANSSILLHPSKSEGTGLPILEAALLGCFPLTTKVGIADELFSKKFPNLILKNDILEFEKTILTILSLKTEERLKLIKIAENFIRKIQKEKVPRELISKNITLQNPLTLSEKTKLLLKWIFRYFNQKRFGPNNNLNIFLIKNHIVTNVGHFP